MLGYVIGGVAIGPYTPGFEADTRAVEQLADIGVILLMFAIGVQLSLDDLLRVGRAATAGAAVQVLVLIGVGYGAGLLLGWGQLESLFFGAVISNSSSTVISKVLGERGEEGTFYGRLSIAWSTVQDFSTIVLIVLLTTLAEGDHDRLALDVARSLGLAGLFLALVIPAGLWLIPRLFARLADVASAEVFVLGSVGLALGIAYLGQAFGVSVAIGAFVGGVLVARSDISHEVLGQIAPIRDIFAGLFFVSVGMLIDPELVLEQPLLVLVAVGLIVAVKGSFSTAVLWAMRFPPKTAVLGGVLLGQSAEFSFLLARAGTETEAVSEDVFGIMLASAAVSIVLAPLTLRAAHPVAATLEARATAGGSQRRDPGEVDIGLVNHAVLCGYGRVGRIVYQSLAAHSIPVVVIEQDGAIVSELREQGILAFRGAASNRFLLEKAGIARAWSFLVAIPDPVAARQAVTIARLLNPAIDIVVRTHSPAERTYLERAGANEAVLAELELAIELSRHALGRFGIAEPIADRVLADIRFAHGGHSHDHREAEL
jgi:CPA2 family monovalent cation:H+ antiporter-2